jgi:EAL domain-containing protein (putative c-di-GMP-specific phosphodiesterase class I)/ABC-type amino acid transport substrate-binding protein
MNKKLKITCCTVITLIIIASVLYSSIYANNIFLKKEDDNVLKIGFYEYNSYFYLDKNNYPSGFYNDLLDLIFTDLNLSYKYVFCKVSEATSKLENGEIDLLFGINKTKERSKKFEYTNHYIAVETYGVYTNKNIAYGELAKLNNLTFGYIPNEANSDWIIGLLKEREINVNLVKANSYKNLERLLINGKVDATISTIDNKKLSNMKKIFEYSIGPVYIAGNKDNKKIVSKIDNILSDYSDKNNNPIEKLKMRYFGNGIIIILSIGLGLVILILCIGLIIYKSKLPYINKNKVQKTVKNNIKNGKYFLQYQPIVNPKNRCIVGFEGLLRLKKDNKILTPYYFIKDIEENDMLYEISTYILKLAIRDYEIIRKYDNMSNDEFYVSVNMSLNEIENDNFIENISKIAKELNMKKHSICIEILERVAINDLSKIKKSIKKLKSFGFKIAIDDFGVEYSNLDILEKLDFDILKLDKYFIDDIDKSIIIKETIKFLSNLCKATNKVLISEGVEHEYQRDIIKNIENDKFYIQGYFYSKPVFIEDIDKINID